MSVWLLYLLLLKATLTTFSGLASLPIVHADLVVRYGVLTEAQLNAAVAAGQVGPGPLGLYLVSVGYFVAGPAGAAAGCIALMTPSLLIIVLLVFAGRRAEAPVVRRMVSAVTVAAAGMLAATTMPLARSSLVDLPHLLIAAGTLLALLRTRLPGALLMLLSAGAGLLLVVLRQQ